MQLARPSIVIRYYVKKIEADHAHTFNCKEINDEGDCC